MDLLVEKLDGSRYYLSQYKVLITDFEESAPSVTRNSKQLDQRNGNIDFGGWHTDKTINITGYYRADDIDEEETLREKLYALLSDPNGYYITQLKTTPNTAMERPGETSGGYYDKLSNYPSHKRFLVYTEAPEMELVGNVNGALLYKLTAEFKTMKLPYGESVQRDLDIKPDVPYIGRNLLIGSTDNVVHYTSVNGYTVWKSYVTQFNVGDTLNVSANITSNFGNTILKVYFLSSTGSQVDDLRYSVSMGKTAHAFVSKTIPAGTTSILVQIDNGQPNGQADVCAINHQFANTGSIATDWSPAPEDPGYNKWYLDTYYNTKNLAIPYSGTVPCNQLEQRFTVQLTANGSASSLSFKIDDTEFTYNGGVASGDVFLLTGFSYTQNGLSIVSKTNKACFILQPDKPNRITCNVPGTVRILGFQNLYA